MTSKLKTKALIDILTSVVIPIASGIFFFVWFIYLFKYQEKSFPAIFPVFILMYASVGNVIGGIFLLFIVAAAIFTFIISEHKYIVILEIIWIILSFLFIEQHRIRYIFTGKRQKIEHEVLDRDISIIKYSIASSEKKTLDTIQKMDRFSSFIKIISSLESSIAEKELIIKIEDLATTIFAKGDWKIRRYSKKDIFINYVKRKEEPLLINDTSRDFRFEDDDYKDIVSLVAMPIKVNDTIWGVITGISKTKNIKFNDSDLRLLSVLTDMLTIVLYNTSLYNKLNELATTDSLTGLYTRTYFIERLKEEMKRSNTNDVPIVMAIIDIDHFKMVNDTYGHQAGDAILKQISEMIRKRFRSVDLLARYGGEEFAILMSHVNIEGAYKTLEELRKNIEKKEFNISLDKVINRTISVGLAQFNGETSCEEIIAKADLALYKAKNSGRNQSCIFKENEKF